MHRQLRELRHGLLAQRKKAVNAADILPAPRKRPLFPGRGDFFLVFSLLFAEKVVSYKVVIFGIKIIILS